MDCQAANGSLKPRATSRSGVALHKSQRLLQRVSVLRPGKLLVSGGRGHTSSTKPERGSQVSSEMVTRRMLPRQRLREACIFPVQTRTLWGGSAGVVADLAPAKAEAETDEGGGWGLEADELDYEFLCPVQLRVRIRLPAKRSICRGGWSNPPGELRLGERRQHIDGFSSRPLSSSPVWKPARKACVASREPPTLPSMSLSGFRKAFVAMWRKWSCRQGGRPPCPPGSPAASAHRGGTRPRARAAKGPPVALSVCRRFSLH